MMNRMYDVAGAKAMALSAAGATPPVRQAAE
jgi:hypothetical protein